MVTHNLINALGQALFESCIQAMLIYIALQVFLKLFPALSAKYRYLANYIALTAMCGWFLVTVAKIYSQALDVTTYIPVAYYHAIPQTYIAPSLLDQAKHLINQYSVYIAGLYILGLIIHIISLVKGLFYVSRIRSKKNLCLSPAWTQNATVLRKKLSLLKNIPVYISEHVNIPLTIGHLKPIIIFPLALINNLDAAQMESILLHELAHIKRRDYLFNIIQTVMETILCFNPFSWLIGKAIRNEREFCCDDMVTGNVEDNYSYAQALYLIAQQNSYAASLTMASSGESKYPLLNRIKRLNRMKTNHQLHKQHLAIIVTITIISILLAWAVPQYTQAKNSKASKPKIIVNPIPVLDVTAKTTVNRSNTCPKTKKRMLSMVASDSLKLLNDTSKLKRKYKIVMEDEKGNKKEYNSVNELSQEDKEAFFKDSFKMNMPDSLEFKLNKHFNSPEWKKEMAAITASAKAMSKQFNSPQWKKQQKQMADQALAMSKQFNSIEWKKQQEEMVKQFNSPEWKKQQQELIEKFNSPEWKKQQKDLIDKFNSPEWKKQHKELIDKFNSPEWKKQQKELLKKLSSPEWKKQVDDMVNLSLNMNMDQASPEYKQQQADLEKQMADLKKQQEDLRKEMEKAQKKGKKTGEAVKDTIK